MREFLITTTSVMSTEVVF